jgi:hypothetical protein
LNKSHELKYKIEGLILSLIKTQGLGANLAIGPRLCWLGDYVTLCADVAYTDQVLMWHICISAYQDNWHTWVEVSYPYISIEDALHPIKFSEHKLILHLSLNIWFDFFILTLTTHFIKKMNYFYFNYNVVYYIVSRSTHVLAWARFWKLFHKMG